MMLRKWAFGAVMISTVMIGLTGFITEGISMYGVSDNVDQGQLQQLEQVQNSTEIAQQAQQRAEQAEARSNFFTLPNIVNLLRLPFQAVGMWELFIGVSMQTLGLNLAPQNWPMMLASSFIIITIAYKFAQRVL